VKLAVSADGFVAKKRGTRTAITGDATNREVHRMRAQSDAIAVGIDTVIADDPQLTVRMGKAPRVPPVRVVFDRTARLPLDSHLVQSAGLVPVAIVAADPPPARELRLFQKGVEVIRAKHIRGALQALRRHEVRSLLVEGGPGIVKALLAARVVDRIVIFRAPRRLGPGGIAAFDDASFLEKFRVTVRRRFGVDQMTVFAVS
jgi:diaminohydroxyphosphoribosylaminopyrimidine deaminase/5-amino-6-(5-phosphoribosylamino)uracil reductase